MHTENQVAKNKTFDQTSNGYELCIHQIWQSCCTSTL